MRKTIITAIALITLTGCIPTQSETSQEQTSQEQTAFSANITPRSSDENPNWTAAEINDPSVLPPESKCSSAVYGSLQAGELELTDSVEIANYIKLDAQQHKWSMVESKCAARAYTMDPALIAEALKIVDFNSVAVLAAEEHLSEGEYGQELYDTLFTEGFTEDQIRHAMQSLPDGGMSNPYEEHSE